MGVQSVVSPIHHLFLPCPFARIILRIVCFAYSIPPPTNITNMFSNWLNDVNKCDKSRILIGMSALCWAIWTCRNGYVFDKQKGTNFFVGYSSRCAVDPTLAISSSRGSTRAYGYWMQPTVDGRS
jgi:hypothetical protein